MVFPLWKLYLNNMSGTYSGFMALSSGRPNLEQLKTARKELAFELCNALHKAKESQERTQNLLPWSLAYRIMRLSSGIMG